MIPRLLLAALALFGSACSSSFDDRWARAGSPSGASTPGASRFDGRWSGRWTSEKHRIPFTQRPESGELRLVLAKTASGKYRANVRAHWLLFRSDYEVFLHGEERGRVLRLRGVQNVRPIFGGPYRYAAVVGPGRFTMRYDSRYDRGKVELTR